MTYLRGLNEEGHGGYTSKSKQRTSIGGDMFANPVFVASTLPSRDARYFKEFLKETDPQKRQEILGLSVLPQPKSLAHAGARRAGSHSHYMDDTSPGPGLRSSASRSRSSPARPLHGRQILPLSPSLLGLIFPTPRLRHFGDKKAGELRFPYVVLILME
jgi:hypothetical protein